MMVLQWGWGSVVGTIADAGLGRGAAARRPVVRSCPVRGAVSRSAVISGVKQGQYRADATMILGCRGKAQLCEDVGHVLLHRPLRDHQSLGDPAVRPALGHQFEHLTLASG